MTVVLKLGGSVITRKGERETIDEASLERAARTVAREADGLVLVHGGGSFGHPIADDHGLARDVGTDDAAAALDVHDAMCLLNDAVVARLQDHGAAALPVHPLSSCVRRSDDLDLAVGPIEAMLDRGFLPVVHGDVIVDAERGISIVSGDELVVALGAALGADRIGLCSAVPGVLDEAGEVVQVVESFEEVAGLFDGPGATDVTGGMAAKVRSLLDLDVPASIFGPQDLPAFLDGGTPGTLVDG